MIMTKRITTALSLILVIPSYIHGLHMRIDSVQYEFASFWHTYTVVVPPESVRQVCPHEAEQSRVSTNCMFPVNEVEIPQIINAFTTQVYKSLAVPQLTVEFSCIDDYDEEEVLVRGMVSTYKSRASRDEIISLSCDQENVIKKPEYTCCRLNQDELYGYTRGFLMSALLSYFAILIESTQSDSDDLQPLLPAPSTNATATPSS